MPFVTASSVQARPAISHSAMLACALSENKPYSFVEIAQTMHSGLVQVVARMTAAIAVHYRPFIITRKSFREGIFCRLLLRES